MGRNDIELDDELVADVMRRYDVRTKREAVDLALRRRRTSASDVLRAPARPGFPGRCDRG